MLEFCETKEIRTMHSSVTIEIPVLVIGFNRPDVLRQSIAKLRESRPRHMYFACDGAREKKPGEEALVAEVRSIMESEVNWECERQYKYNSVNKGAEITVSEAISWVLADNEYIVVLEDDILAPYSFLRFTQEMLYRYKDEVKIYQITSCNYTPMSFPNGEDYTFGFSGHISGWATWKRAWNHFNLFVDDFEETLNKVKMRNDLSASEKKRFINSCHRLMKKGKGHSSWDTIWAYIKKRDGGLTIIPRVHLSSNVGAIGLHSKEAGRVNFLKYDEYFIAKIHPKKIKRNIEYDEFHYQNWMKKPTFIIRQYKRAVRLIKRLLR